MMQNTDTRRTAEDRSQAAAAIDQLNRPDDSLYEYNKPVAGSFWPELSELQIAWVSRVASDLQLDILREEVIWYQDRPYVTIKGLLRLLNQHPQFDNYELEPASEEVRRAMRVKSDDEQVWICRVWRKDRSRPSIGYGRATSGDTAVGYGQATGVDQDPSHHSQTYRTPAVAEMAQGRAIRHASQGAFSWQHMSTLEATASEDHRRVDPENGEISAVLEDGASNSVGCTASQRRCVHAVARALGLPEGRIDTENGEVLEEGWRADLYRLYGKKSTMQLTVAEASEFIDSLTAERSDLDEAEGPEETERGEAWQRVQDLLEGLPRDTPPQVCVWFGKELGLEVTSEELRNTEPPAHASIPDLKKLIEGLEGYKTKLVTGPR